MTLIPSQLTDSEILLGGTLHPSKFMIITPLVSGLKSTNSYVVTRVCNGDVNFQNVTKRLLVLLTCLELNTNKAIKKGI